VYLKNSRSGPGIGVVEKTLMCLRVIETIRARFPEALQSATAAPLTAIPVDTAAGTAG
jgi:hypothetical protein